MENLIVLERGEWTAKNLVIHPIVNDRKLVQLYSEDDEVIKKSWDEILKKNPKAFPGPTVRLVGRHHLGKKLVLEVLPSDYREGFAVLGWLSVAMVLVTSDGYIALQGAVVAVVATVGSGIRVPGCTPPHHNFISHIIKEMHEEFGVTISPHNLTILGVVESRPPISRPHHGLIVRVKLKENRGELQKSWEKSEDKWEGELKFLKFSSAEIKSVIDNTDYHAGSRLILKMVAESEGISL